MLWRLIIKYPEPFETYRGTNSWYPKMIEDEKECMDVITQLSAVRSSIDRVMGMIVADNLKNCFEKPDSNPEEQAAKLEQAIKMIIKK